MNEMKDYWYKSGIFAFLSNSVTLMFAFFTFLVLVRVLPKNQFGIWVLYLTVVTFAEMIRNGMTNNALVKFLSGQKGDEYKRIATASLFIFITTGVLGYLIIVALSGTLSSMWSAPTLKPLLYLYGIYIVTYMPMQFMQFMAQANMDFKMRFFSNLTYNATYFLLVVVLYLVQKTINIFYLPLLQFTAAFFALVIGFGLSRRYLHFCPQIDWSWVAKLFHFGKYVVGTNISSMLFNRMDLMMLGYFLNPSAVALYNVPTRIGNYVEVPMNTMSSVVLPQASLRLKERGLDHLRYLYEKSVGSLMAIIIPLAILLAVFAKPIILIIAGKEYLDAVPILRLFAIASVIKPWGRQGGTILSAMGYPNWNMYSILISLVINFFLNWYFIVHYGIIGAIIATILAIFIGTLIQQLVLRHFLKTKAHHPFVYLWVTYRDGWKLVREKWAAFRNKK